MLNESAGGRGGRAEAGLVRRSANRRKATTPPHSPLGTLTTTASRLESTFCTKSFFSLTYTTSGGLGSFMAEIHDVPVDLPCTGRGSSVHAGKGCSARCRADHPGSWFQVTDPGLGLQRSLLPQSEIPRPTSEQMPTPDTSHAGAQGSIEPGSGSCRNAKQSPGGDSLQSGLGSPPSPSRTVCEPASAATRLRTRGTLYGTGGGVAGGVRTANPTDSNQAFHGSLFEPLLTSCVERELGRARWGRARC